MKRPLRRCRGGGDRLALAGPAVGVTFLGGLIGAMARSELPFPRPGSTADEIDTYFKQPSRAPLISVAGQLLSAASLAVWTARVAALNEGKPGARKRAIAGGTLAAASLGVSGVCAASLVVSPKSERTAKVARAAFAAGGPTHGVGFGLLMSALGESDRISAPVARAARASVLPNVLSPAYFAWEPAGWLIPLGRFPGLILTGIAGAQLAKSGTRS